MGDQDNKSIKKGLITLHSNRMDNLRHLLVNWTKSYPLDPLEDEIILLQSSGMNQWLKIAFARSSDHEEGGLGIASGIDTQLPSQFLWKAYRYFLGKEKVPENSLLDKIPLTWLLMKLLPSIVQKPEFSSLRFAFNSRTTDLRERYYLSKSIAHVFKQYQVYRSDWLEDWSNSLCQIRNLRGVSLLDKDNIWQAKLWKILSEYLRENSIFPSRTAIHKRFMEKIRIEKKSPRNFPRRIIIFGVSSIPEQVLEGLVGLAKFSQVIICVQNPCRFYWNDVIQDKVSKESCTKELRGEKYTETAYATNNLLSLWGKQGRDYIKLLDKFESSTPDIFPSKKEKIEIFTTNSNTHLLSRLQNDILELRTLEESRDFWPPVELKKDYSIRFHMTYSAQREIEVLHDQLLSIFRADPELNPHDIIVMMPDVEPYIPSIYSVFNRFKSGDIRFIPFSVGDKLRASYHSLSLLNALEYLLRLPESKFPVSEVLSLLNVPEIRNKFDIQESDLPSIRSWVIGSGIRWGLNAKQRVNSGLQRSIEQNSWSFGLRRIMLGYAVGLGEPYKGIEPYGSQMEGGEFSIFGSLVDFIDALETFYYELTTEATPQIWAKRLRNLIKTFFKVDKDRNKNLFSELDEILDSWLETCVCVNFQENLPLSLVRKICLDQVFKKKVSQNFSGGSVNFCTLLPMRSIPFKVVCLLGMNDESYPRSGAILSFDLMNSSKRTGDPSRVEEDRYLFLEAILSASKILYVSYVGKNIVNGSKKNVCVLVSQLRSYLAKASRITDPRDLLEGITQKHPPQPFNRKYFDRNYPDFFSYNHEWVSLYKPGNFFLKKKNNLISPLKCPKKNNTITLNDLRFFLCNPVDYFFKHRLKVSFKDNENLVKDEEPFILNPLELYIASIDLIQSRLLTPQKKIDFWTSKLERKGLLPIGGFGREVKRDLTNSFYNIDKRYQRLLEFWPIRTKKIISIDLVRENIFLKDYLDKLHMSHDNTLISIRAIPINIGKGKSKKWQHLLPSWINHLAACCSGEKIFTGLVSLDNTLIFDPLDKNIADSILSELILSWKIGLENPLPVALNTAFSWLTNSSDNAMSLAKKVYEGDGYILYSEGKKNIALLRQFPTFHSLISSNEFQKWCNTLYKPLLDTPLYSLD